MANASHGSEVAVDSEFKNRYCLNLTLSLFNIHLPFVIHFDSACEVKKLQDQLSVHYNLSSLVLASSINRTFKLIKHTRLYSRRGCSVQKPHMSQQGWLRTATSVYNTIKHEINRCYFLKTFQDLVDYEYRTALMSNAARRFTGVIC